MIRILRKSDIERLAEIWLYTNIKAHNFISEQYWKDKYSIVKEKFLKAEVYVYEEENKNIVQGFVGLSGDYIEGIFVNSEVQCCGIGKQLLDFVKGIKNQLSLSVYKKNKGAVKFYHRESFTIKSEQLDENTGEKEYFMIWKQK